MFVLPCGTISLEKVLTFTPTYHRILASTVKAATPLGTLVGQLLFGWLADRVGRKRMCTFSHSDNHTWGNTATQMVLSSSLSSSVRLARLYLPMAILGLSTSIPCLSYGVSL
jgi:MFS family permease